VIDGDLGVAVAELETEQEELMVRVGGVTERVLVGEKLRVFDDVSDGVAVMDGDGLPCDCELIVGDSEPVGVQLWLLEALTVSVRVAVRSSEPDAVWVGLELHDAEGDKDMDAEAVPARLPEKLWLGPVADGVPVGVHDRFVLLRETERLRDMVSVQLQLCETC